MVVVSPTDRNDNGGFEPVAYESKVEFRSFVVRPRWVSTIIIVGTIPYKKVAGS